MTSCTSNHHQINSTEFYLHTPELIKSFHSKLMTSNDKYSIPADLNEQGAVGKNLDISPPHQSLIMINGLCAKFCRNSTQLFFEKHKYHDLWKHITALMYSNRCPIIFQHNKQQILITDWINWKEDNKENDQYSGCYQINLLANKNYYGIQITIINLRHMNTIINDHDITKLFLIKMIKRFL